MSKISMDLGPLSDGSGSHTLSDALASSIHTGILAGLTELGQEVSAMIEVVLVSPSGWQSARCEVVFLHNLAFMGSVKSRAVCSLHRQLERSFEDVTRKVQRILVSTVHEALQESAQVFTQRATKLLV